MSITGDAPDSHAAPAELVLLRPISPSALDDFAVCRRRFRFSHVDGRRGLYEPSPELVLGHVLHRALRELFRLAPGERDQAAAERLFRRAWAQVPDRGQIFLTDEAEAATGRVGLRQLATYVEHYSHELEIRPLALEHTLRAPLANGAVIGGRVDRVDRGHSGSPAGSLIVTDYKSGVCRFDGPGDLAEDRAAQVYALLVSRLADQPVTEVCFHYLRENRQLRWPIEADDLELIEQRLLAATREVVLEQEFPTSPGHHCNWCRHRLECPEGEGELTRAQVMDERPPEVPF